MNTNTELGRGDANMIHDIIVLLEKLDERRLSMVYHFIVGLLSND